MYRLDWNCKICLIFVLRIYQLSEIKDEIPVFPILNIHVRNKKSEISSLYHMAILKGENENTDFSLIVSL